MNTLNIFKGKLAKQGYEFIVKKEYQEKYKGGIYQKGKKLLITNSVKSHKTIE